MLIVTLAAGLLAGRFLVAGRGDGGEGSWAAGPAVAGGGAPAEVARLQAEVGRRPGQPRLLTRLGVAYLARARETADPAWYAKAAGVLGQASKLGQADPETMVARGLLDLGRHDFRPALAWGTRAARANPDLPDALGVVFDAEVELGRYQAAVATAQAMVDRKPAQGSLARVSYARELLGDPAGAVAAMVQAAAAGGSPADQAYVQTLLGNLHLGAGRLSPAEAAYRRALGGLPSAGLAEVGLARVAAARGDLAGAARLLEPVADRLPLPATVALLGDVRAALGDPEAAAAQYRLVRVIERLNQANGVAVDLELARFEADHARDPGADPRRGVALARRAMAERPTIYAADTLGWALRQAGQSGQALPHARAAVRLGTRDAVLWYHLAAVEADLGMAAAARRHMAEAFAISPYLTVRDQPAALALAGRLHLPAPRPDEQPMSRFAHRVAALAVLAAMLVVAGATRAAAHPLGNFTVNTYSGLRVGPDRLEVDYVLDMAEIPTFQARQAVDTDHNGTITATEAAAWRDRECPRLVRDLRATADGRALTLTVTGSALSFPKGAASLETLRLECALTSPLPAPQVAGRSLTYADNTQQGRIGWHEITAVGDRTTLDADVPGTSASARLTAYPKDQLSSPLDQRTASLHTHPGGSQAPAPAGPAAGSAPGSAAGSAGSATGSYAGPAGGRVRANPAPACEVPRRGNLADPELGCSWLSTAPAGGPTGAEGSTGAGNPTGGGNGSPDPGNGGPGVGNGVPGAVTRGGVDRVTAAFTALVGGRSRSPGLVVVALLVAVGLGAVHALAPGHGKTVMAAYLVGLRGTARQAAAIGATVTVTHTAGVLVLGVVLSSSRAVASERLYPWLGLASGLLLAAVGLGLLLWARPAHHHHHHEHHDHGHHHDHDQGRPPGLRGLVALGLAGGLVPSPSAVVVLLGGIALGRAWFGVALVLAYGVGMAATLIGIGLLLARLRARMDRRLQLPAGSLLARAGRLLPAVTASVIVVVGLALAASGAAQL